MSASPTTAEPVAVCGSPEQASVPVAALDLHQLVRDGNVAGIVDMERHCTRAEWQRALCARDHADLTPLAVACQLGSVETATTLLSLGSARSIFVRGFRQGELLCTLPYVSTVPERHSSTQGRALACQRQLLFEELSEKERLDTDTPKVLEQLKDTVDTFLQRYIQDLAAGTVDFYDPLLYGDESMSMASTVERARSASPSPSASLRESGNGSPWPSLSSLADALVPSDTMCVGDLVRLSPGSNGSTILVSTRGTDNHAASRACLGAESQKRLGVVMRSLPETLVVASLSSGHLCEYRPQVSSRCFTLHPWSLVPPRKNSGTGTSALLCMSTPAL